MDIDLEKINRLPADVKKDFFKTYLKLLDKKKNIKLKMILWLLLNMSGLSLLKDHTTHK